MEMTKPILKYNSQGEDGNIFFILGKVSQLLKKERRYTDFNNLRDEVLSAGSYAEALAIIGKVVTLVDISI